MLGVEPEKTIFDLVVAPGELDSEKLAGYVTHHPCGLEILPAPLRPEDAELVTEAKLARLLEVARESYDAIIVDTSPFFHGPMLATLDRTDELFLLCGLDVPTLKNVKLALQTLEMLSFPRDRIKLVLNRANSKVGMKPSEVDDALGMKVLHQVPSDRVVPLSVNRGKPAVLAEESADFSKALRLLAKAVIPKPPVPAGSASGCSASSWPRRRRWGSRTASASRPRTARRPSPTSRRRRRPRRAGERAPQSSGVVDPYAELKTRIHHAVIETVGVELFKQEMTEDLHDRVLRAVTEQLVLDRTPLTREERRQIVGDITDDILGYGPIEPLLRDDSISEVMVNAFDQIYCERGGKLERTNTAFVDNAHLMRIIDKIVSQVGRRVDEASPMVDARLPDGSRVNAIIPPLALKGPTLTIRKFSRDPYTMNDLISFGSVSPKAAQFLAACVKGKLNILISGGTGTGKTTTLNAMSAFVPEDERIVTIEDAAELQLQQDHVITLESRPPNIEGVGRGAHPRARPQRPAHAARPDHRRRGPRRRDAGHAPGDEHGPRGLADDDPRELAARRAQPPRDARAHRRRRPAAPRDPRADLERVRPARPDLAPRRRHPPHHARDRGAAHGVRRDHAAGHLHDEGSGGGLAVGRRRSTACSRRCSAPG